MVAKQYMLMVRYTTPMGKVYDQYSVVDENEFPPLVTHDLMQGNYMISLPQKAGIEFPPVEPAPKKRGRPRKYQTREMTADV